MRLVVIWFRTKGHNKGIRWGESYAEYILKILQLVNCFQSYEPTKKALIVFITPPNIENEEKTKDLKGNLEALKRIGVVTLDLKACLRSGALGSITYPDSKYNTFQDRYNGFFALERGLTTNGKRVSYKE